MTIGQVVSREIRRTLYNKAMDREASRLLPLVKARRMTKTLKKEKGRRENT